MALPKLARGVVFGLAVGMTALVALSATQAEAAPTRNSCSAGNVFDVSGTSLAVNGCEYLTPPDQNYVASVSNINSAGFFGYTDWKSNGQDQLKGTGSEGQSGSWSISGLDFATRDYIIVFKDGQGTNLIAFSFNESYASGTWTTPFTNPPFTDLKANQSKDVSHLTIAYRNNATGGAEDIPEPASLALFGAGLAGLGLALRRRRRDA